MTILTQDIVNEIINKMMDIADEKKAHGLWLLGDMIEEMPYTKTNHANIRAIKILEKMDQENNDVKNLRRYLKL